MFLESTVIKSKVSTVDIWSWLLTQGYGKVLRPMIH